jgi:Zn-dependent protease with chaperone function
MAGYQASGTGSRRNGENQKVKALIEKVRLAEEAELLAHLEAMFSAPSVTNVLALQDATEPDNLLAQSVNGFCFPLSGKFGGELHAVCRQVVAALGLDGGRDSMKVDFFLSNDPSYNALAFFNHDAGQPHYIVLNSGLVDALTPDELKFVVGHELGHLVFRHSCFERVMSLSYKNPEEMPQAARSLHDLWSKLSEISSDRVGLLAVGEIGPALSAMFKLSSGLSMSFLKMDARSYLEMARAQIDLLEKQEGPSLFFTHPAHPVRVKALELFNESKLFSRLKSRGEAVEDPELSNAMEAAVAVLRKIPRSEREDVQARFLAAAGFLIMTSDGDISPAEVTFLDNVLANFCYLPGALYEDYFGGGNEKKLQKGYRAARKTVSETAATIVKDHPDLVRPIAMTLVELVIRDNRLDPAELDLLAKISTDHLKIPLTELNSALHGAMEERFRPMG